jgi:serpin B
MRRYRIIHCLLLTFFLFLPACAAVPAKAQEVHSDLPRDLSPQVTDADLAALVSGNSDFAFALYHQIAGGDRNLVYSPYSISIALAMTYAGARGQTADQMAQALSFTLPADRLHPAFNRLALELASRSKTENLKPDEVFHLNVANALWGQTGYPFEQDFLDLLARNYSGGMRLLDFKKNPESARRTINDWVSSSTEKKIQDIVPPGAINKVTRLVLANAVYFKAAWLNPFKPENTQPGSFQLLDGSDVQVSMMHWLGGMKFAQGDGYGAVELPYAGGQLSMLLVLPEEGRFSSVEAELNTGFVDAIVAGMQMEEIALSLPKIKFEWEADRLPDKLKALGMLLAFDPGADFTGISLRDDLFIGDVLHKAFVAVDEKGTEAAAATVVLMTASAAVQAMEFNLDRPFFFLIRDNPTGTILFLGRVMNPAAG